VKKERLARKMQTDLTVQAITYGCCGVPGWAAGCMIALVPCYSDLCWALPTT
jgi:hypothetical protein